MADLDLRDRLRKMGVQVGAAHLKPRPSRRGPAIEEVIRGEFIDSDHGPCFLAEERYPLEYLQGRVPLSSALNQTSETIVCLARDERLAAFDAGSAVFVDIETSGLAGGTGTYAFLVGVGYFADEGFHLRQFFMRDPAEERAMLAALGPFLERFAAVVSFNGKAFDLPLLQTRFIYHRWRLPLVNLPHLDLLHSARRLWKERLASCGLSSLEEHILDLRRAQADVPSWLVPRLYFDYLRSGDARPLAGVFYHNGQDILSLVALVGHMVQVFDHPFSRVGRQGADLYALGKLYEEAGLVDRAQRAYQGALASPLPPAIREAALYRLSFLYKRQGSWGKATRIWHSLIGNAQLYPYVELAKYYEHRVRNYGRAEELVLAAIDLVQSPRFPHPLGRKRTILAELEHRLERLRRKGRKRGQHGLFT